MASFGPFINLGKQPKDVMYLQIQFDKHGIPESIETWTIKKEKNVLKISELTKPYPMYVYNMTEGMYYCLYIDQNSHIYQFPYVRNEFRPGIPIQADGLATDIAPIHPKRIFPIADKMLTLTDEQLAKLIEASPAFPPNWDKVKRNDFENIIKQTDKLTLTEQQISELLSKGFVNDWKTLKLGCESSEEYVQALRSVIKGTINDKNNDFSAITLTNASALRHYLLLDQLKKIDSIKNITEKARHYLINLLQNEMMQFAHVELYENKSDEINETMQIFITMLVTDPSKEETFYSNLESILSAYVTCPAGAKHKAYQQLKNCLNPELMKVFDEQYRLFQDNASLRALDRLNLVTEHQRSTDRLPPETTSLSKTML